MSTPKITLTLPDGTDVTAPDVSTIERLTTDPERYFNGAGCGEAALEYHGDELTSYLAIRYVASHRQFSMEWKATRGPEAPNSASILIVSPLTAQTVSTSVGGMPLHVPLASLLAPEVACRVMSRFYNDGHASTDARLAKLCDVPADCYFWNAPPATE